MSSGTQVIEAALEEIGAHSLVQPALPETINMGKNALNSMLQQWLSWDIDLGIAPLDAPGDELNEPTDAYNGIVQNLAIEISGKFDNGKVVVSPQLRANAAVNFNRIQSLYEVLTIPNKIVSSTLPRGAGNSRGVDPKVYFPKGHEVNG